MKKFICDKCGRELTDKYDIESILEGSAAWHASVRAKGEEPRGIFPCENYRNCGGEMIHIETRVKGIFRRGGKSN